MALNNDKKQSHQKKRKSSDIHDGIIGHHTGNLDNQSGDHDDHSGNHGNQTNCDDNPITSSDEQNSDVGYHDNSDGSTDGNYGNKNINCRNVDGCHGNSDGSQSDENGNLGGGTDGNLRNMDGSQSAPDGNHNGTNSETDDSNPGITNNNIDSTIDITSKKALVSTNKSMDAGNSEVITSNKTISSVKPVQTCDNTINMVATHQNNDITALNKTISSSKALENSDSGNVSENAESSPLQMCSVEDVTEYLGKLWEFHDITKEQERKLLLTDTNEMPRDATQEYKSTQILRTIPYLVHGVNHKSKNNERVVINPAGKSARSLLHEYCIKLHNVKPEYTTEESGVPKTPFLAIVQVDGLKYGTGMATSKKQAKHCAAQKTLEILMPKKSFKKLMDVDANVKLFDDIPIEDSNVYELTSKLGLLSPHQVLNECIKRNQGVLTSEVKFELSHGADKQLYYTMECGKHKATGPCRNKKLGRELAAQTVLQKLHPHLKSWGSILRIYVDDHTAQEFTKPDAPAPVTPSSVNKELLSDLKHEMWKFMKKKAKASTGFITNIDI
ncbi:Hypothetical predicted protein [Paramuricea clavata]|nr:Hypothetical predicted protein [Paramuricea clavata]